MHNSINIPYARQDINQHDVDAVTEVLYSDFLTQGPVVPAFEAAVTSYSGGLYAVAVNSATSALHIACLALGVGKGDIVWTTPITFVATANCALYCGATIDFVDIDPQTYNLSVECLASKLEAAEKEGNLPKVVIPVHLCGQPCDMITIHSLSLRYGFKIIEDASHAIGGKYQDEPIGKGRYSSITVFSFHPVKIITTGEGGMAVTNDADLARRMRLLRSHGITSDPNYMEERSPTEIWNYQQISLGFNYRMTDIAAALGLSQMRRLDEFIKRRRALANRYDQQLLNTIYQTPWQHPDSYSAYHLYVLRLNINGTSQRNLYQNLHSAGIIVNLHYIPIHTQPYYAKLGFNAEDFPASLDYFRKSLSIPMFSQLSDADQERVIAVLRQLQLVEAR